MRISGDPEDTVGHANYQKAIMDHKIPFVFLNGVRVLGPIIADEEEGYVLAYLYDPRGLQIYDPNKKHWADVELRGKVEIFLVEKEATINGIH